MLAKGHSDPTKTTPIITARAPNEGEVSPEKCIGELLESFRGSLRIRRAEYVAHFCSVKLWQMKLAAVIALAWNGRGNKIRV